MKILRPHQYGNILVLVLLHGKIKMTNKGVHNSPETEFKKGQVSLMKGRHHTDESKDLMKNSHLGKPSKRKGIKTGKHPWNFRLTKDKDERVKRNGESISKSKHGIKLSETHKKNVSSSMMGRKLSESHIENLSGKKNHRYGKVPSHGKRHIHDSPLQGRIYLRSTYELAYAKYLDSIHELWMYELETFELLGEMSYKPDFFLPRLEKFVEIKGYLFPEDKLKIQKFQEEYPWDLEVLYKKDLLSLGIIVK